MSQELVSKLDLRLAWQRLQADPRSRAFVRHPFEAELVKVDLDGWLDGIAKEVAEGMYAPTAVTIVNVPKGKGAVRPAASLSLKDRLVYTACVGAILPAIAKALSWSSEQLDFSYPLASRTSDVRWVTGSFKGWDSFREKSLKLLDGNAYAVIADVTGYYENIDLVTLRSDLLAAKADNQVIDLLMLCLNRWVQVGGRGIPQGHTPSDILGKLYLNSVDRTLFNEEYSHCRYVDDIRIFCEDYARAKWALITLSELLRKRGLNIQSAKSAIHRADDARQVIDGITPVIRSVKDRYIADAMNALNLGVYASIRDLEDLLNERPDETPIEVLHETYKAYFIDADPADFDKTLFHFVIKRLGKAKDRFAVSHCKQLLERQPEETEYLLDYFAAVGVPHEVADDLVAYMESKEAVYSYQNYQIIEWLTEHLTEPSQKVLVSVRRRAFQSGHQWYLRSVAREFLAKFGDDADLERLEHGYENARSPLEQAEILCCLRRVERTRRNSFLARAARDCDLTARAAKWVRALPQV